jgi:hypothetical protein
MQFLIYDSQQNKKQCLQVIQMIQVLQVLQKSETGVFDIKTTLLSVDPIVERTQQCVSL